MENYSDYNKIIEESDKDRIRKNKENTKKFLEKIGYPVEYFEKNCKEEFDDLIKYIDFLKAQEQKLVITSKNDKTNYTLFNQLLLEDLDKNIIPLLDVVSESLNCEKPSKFLEIVKCREDFFKRYRDMTEYERIEANIEEHYRHAFSKHRKLIRKNFIDESPMPFWQELNSGSEWEIIEDITSTHKEKLMYLEDYTKHFHVLNLYGDNPEISFYNIIYRDLKYMDKVMDIIIQYLIYDFMLLAKENSNKMENTLLQKLKNNLSDRIVETLKKGEPEKVKPGLSTYIFYEKLILNDYFMREKRIARITESLLENIDDVEEEYRTEGKFYGLEKTGLKKKKQLINLFTEGKKLKDNIFESKLTTVKELIKILNKSGHELQYYNLQHLKVVFREINESKEEFNRKTAKTIVREAKKTGKISNEENAFIRAKLSKGFVREKGKIIEYKKVNEINILLLDELQKLINQNNVDHSIIVPVFCNIVLELILEVYEEYNIDKEIVLFRAKQIEKHNQVLNEENIQDKYWK